MKNIKKFAFLFLFFLNSCTGEVGRTSSDAQVSSAISDSSSTDAKQYTNNSISSATVDNTDVTNIQSSAVESKESPVVQNYAATGSIGDTYPATVEYHNGSTGYSASYNLDVTVENNQVTKIEFPNGGELNEDHITAEELDDDGNATVQGENGKTYDVHIDK